MISHRLLLTLLSPAQRQGRQGGFSLLSGLVVILVLITGSLALVSVTTGDLLGSGRRSTSRDAFATAEAGADLIIASLNQPENRRLLVAGQPLSAWASAGANPALRSPCTLPDGSGPGADGTGQPSQRAASFAWWRSPTRPEIRARATGARIPSPPAAMAARARWEVSTAP